MGFVSRFLPGMSPVRGLPAPTEEQLRFASTTGTVGQGVADHSPPPVLLLEGDNFEVSHDGIARTFYHLLEHPAAVLGSNKTPVGIEEYYDLQQARKTFIVRQEGLDDDNDSAAMLLGKRSQGLAPMGQALGRIDIQEIDKGVFGASGTGGTTWESSLAMGLLFTSRPDLLRGSLLEIGSGVGLGAILSFLGPLAASHGGLRHLQSVTLTDGNDEVLQQCRDNIRNAWKSLSSLHATGTVHQGPEVHVKKLDWNQSADMRDQYDTILACDVCYLYPDIEPLVATIRQLLAKDGCAHFFGPIYRGAFQHLCQTLHQEMEVTAESLPLERYRLKPAQHALRSAWEPIQPQDRVYASKSQAMILHVMVRHRSTAYEAGEKNSRSDMH